MSVNTNDTNPNNQGNNSDPESILKNIVLLTWIFILALTSTVALGGGFSKIFEHVSNLIQSSITGSTTNSQTSSPNSKCEIQEGKQSNGEYLSPTKQLDVYICSKYKDKPQEEIPPIGIVLDHLQTTSWRDSTNQHEINNIKTEINNIKTEIDTIKGIISTLDPQSENPEISQRLSELDEKIIQIQKEVERDIITGEDYMNLFERVENELIGISRDPTITSERLEIANNILLQKFRFSGENFQERIIPLPRVAKNWVLRERQRQEELKLVDTFFIVMILGALGSIVFLIRLNISEDSLKTELQSYFYRPIFGITLSIASFVISVSLSGSLSGDSIFRVNTKSIWILAFAAGLLSDNTYEYMSSISQSKTKPQQEQS